MNAIFVAKKPAGLSSNHFLNRLKRKYNCKKAGFSGTLDPFASGALLVAFGSYTRLFSHINKSPKIYKATMWLGAKSESGDNQNISEIAILPPFEPEILNKTIAKLSGEISYTPPKFSAKNINGTRAYKLARSGVDFELKTQTMQVFNAKITNYSHPFLSFEISVSEGSYVRSYAQIFAKNLGVNATLSALERVSEGGLCYENERFLDPVLLLNLEKNEYFGDILEIKNGKKLDKTKFKRQTNGKFLLIYDDFFSIIEIKNDEVIYCLNKVEKC
ncbi:tRNA pseudouridine(55) synthase TruB [Campylobacter gastrosuis]|uniref:tRNA pseudouridine synthase B n=1 Tax=Campylobacter gastrosuis TaxID=2974576 RepID=A0ABT7HLT5_9BACT|nr:tRNA pseudouridine(55) synthase TruB [Campylobacter gastrosuis]MDL0087924.1 tRNA pseudouridine(55) synthase TruB [Campylobacter gastrosuis]